MHTVTYKHLPHSDLFLHFDVYYPDSVLSSEHSTYAPVPAVIYFHGGGLTVGNRNSWFPTWLKQRTVDAGYLFITADYRLLPPSTGHEIVEDIRDLFAFLTSTPLSVPSTEAGTLKLQVNPNAIAVSGSSAGGLCTYLAASHPSISPKPKAVVSMYGMGGNFFTNHYLLPKHTPFFRGRELLDPADFREFLHPFSEQLPEIAESKLKYHPQTYRIPGYPANPRMLLARLYLQMGTFLDYYTGEYGLSGKLRAAVEELATDANLELVPAIHHTLFPQFSTSASWPATMLLHGVLDSAVPVHESRNLKKLLEGHGVKVELREFEGEEHSFDYAPGAEDKYIKEMDEVAEFLRVQLGRSPLI
ncbi:Alpha/Beta hydrolase protein [Cyathus striatus]|nr:Alpha/Beta hydrolase protein [Cyathus striatus]